MSEHEKWFVINNGERLSNGWFISNNSDVLGPLGKEEAEEIVRACNVHHELLEALEEAKAWILIFAEGSHITEGMLRADDRYRKIEAAIAKAELEEDA